MPSSWRSPGVSRVNRGTGIVEVVGEVDTRPVSDERLDEGAFRGEVGLGANALGA